MTRLELIQYFFKGYSKVSKDELQRLVQVPRAGRLSIVQVNYSEYLVKRIR